jgi:hypothetical protein
MQIDSEQPALSGTQTLAGETAQALVIAKARKARCGFLRITWREETSICPYGLAVSTASSGYDWDPVSHRLDDCQPE